MMNKVLCIISIVELVIIAVLATMFFMPKQKPTLSEMRYEKQVDFLKDNGVEEDELFFAVKCIEWCEENPYFEPIGFSNPQLYPIVEKVRKAVNKYYGINAPEEILTPVE